MLSNIRLPHIDGIALTRVIKRMKPETAIVAATGHGQHARNLELESLGVAHLPAKPYETQKVTGYTPERAGHRLMIDRIGLTNLSGIASMEGKHFVRSRNN